MGVLVGIGVGVVVEVGEAGMEVGDGGMLVGVATWGTAVGVEDAVGVFVGSGLDVAVGSGSGVAVGASSTALT